MKTRFLTFCFLLFAFCFPVCGGTFHVQWLFRDASSNVLSVKQVFIQPIAAYGVDASTVIISGDRLSKTSDSTGSLIVSNLFNGRSYRVQLIGPFIQTTFTNSFDTNVTGLVNGADPLYLSAPIRDTAVVAYSQAAADARFHQVAGDTSTNAAFRGTLKIPAGATVGYVFTVTNSDGSGAWQAATSAGSTSNFLAGQNTIWATVGGSNQVSVTGTLTNPTTGNASTATVATNAINATNLWTVSPIHLLTVTKRDGQAFSTGKFNTSQVTNSSYLLIAPPGTEGVVRELFIQADVGTDAGLNNCINDLRLLVYADSNLTVNVSLAELWGMRYKARTGDSWQLHRTSRYINSFADTDFYLTTPFPLYQAVLKIPMPFTNGCWARITNAVGGTNWTAGYLAAQLDYTPLPIPLLEHRMYCWSTNRVLSGTSNFWFSQTGSGQIIGINYGLTNTDPAQTIGFQDSQGFGFGLNGAYNWYPDGMDDFFHSTFGGALGVFIGEDVGTTTSTLDATSLVGAGHPYCLEGYRWLYNDPVSFTNGFNLHTDGGSANNAYFTIWYYRKP